MRHSRPLGPVARLAGSMSLAPAFAGLVAPPRAARLGTSRQRRALLAAVAPASVTASTYGKQGVSSRPRRTSQGDCWRSELAELIESALTSRIEIARGEWNWSIAQGTPSGSLRFPLFSKLADTRRYLTPPRLLMRPQLTGATLARREPCLSISRSGLNQPGALATIELRLFRCLAGTSSCLPTAQAACLAALRRPKSSRRERAASR
jgi:hypothetical protein